MLEQITANLSGAVRRDVMHGRDFLVAPLSMIVPGVLNGSNGPLYYSEEEVQRDPSRWDGMPITLGHPTASDGSPVKARNPKVLNRFQIGTVFHARYDRGKLRAEGWFDIGRLQSTDQSLMDALQTGRRMELSTGLTAEYEWTEGTHNGVSYRGIVRDIKPDHLAILLRERGACSLKDGCGVLVNMSYDDIRREISAQLEGERFGDPNQVDRYLEEVYPEAFVYRKDGKFWLMKYIVKDEVLTILDSAPQEVQLYRQYKVVGAEPNVGQVENTNNQDTDKEEPDMAKKTDAERKALIDSLIANCDCYDESDREVLNKFSDERLAVLDEHVKTHRELVANKAKADEVIANAAKEGAKELQPKKEETVVNKEEKSKPQTTDEWLRVAPPEVQSVVRNAMAAEKRQKDALVEQITANERNKFTKEHLMMKDVQELEAIAALAETQKPSSPPLYIGAAGGTTNKGKTDEEELLPLPTINWSEKA